MEGLDDVKRELDGKRQVLSDELQQAQAKIDAIEADLRKIDDALAALEGKKPKARSKAPKRPAVTLEQLREMIASVRQDMPFAETIEFEKTLRERVKQSGHSLAGFKKTYEEAIAGMSEPSEPFGFDHMQN